VRAPLRTKTETIREFVLEHADWILRRLRKLDVRSASAPYGPRCKEGEMHPYLGQIHPPRV
jgi:predicted metal-dependent hydrolase